MPSQLPNAFLNLLEAYESLAAAIHSAGRLSDHERQLVKLALSVGAGLEGPTHSHTRRSLEQGLTAEEIRQMALLGVTTLGLPSAVRGYT